MLRWMHDGLHSNMIWGNGTTHESRTIYELTDLLWRGEVVVEHLEPLDIVCLSSKFYSASNRRLAALKGFMATLWTCPCLQVQYCNGQGRVLRKPSLQLFCAERVWNPSLVTRYAAERSTYSPGRAPPAVSS